MKPWPIELQKIFPRNDGMRPDRPWWPDSSKHSGHVRRDGTVIYLYDAVRECEVSFTQVPAMQDACDKEQPIPHPGFRVGQIWASSDGYVVTIVGAHRYTARGDIAYQLSWADPNEAFLNEEHIARDLNDYFLVHDPVCPWLAPWSPPERLKPWGGARWEPVNGPPPLLPP